MSHGDWFLTSFSRFMSRFRMVLKHGNVTLPDKKIPLLPFAEKVE